MPQIAAHIMMTSSNGNIFRVTGHLCGEFTGTRWIPLTKASDAELFFFDLWLYKRLSKQSTRRLYETPSRSLWRHCNVCRIASRRIAALEWRKNPCAHVTQAILTRCKRSNLKRSEVRKSKSFARIILPPQNKAQRKCFCFMGYTVFNPIAAHIHKRYCIVVRLSGVLNGRAQQSPKRVFLMTLSTGNIIALLALCEGNWSVTEKPVKQTIESLVIWDVIPLIMTSL